MITCTTDCPVPGCKKFRKLWKHYRKCRVSTCPLCSAAPTQYCTKALSNRFKKNLFSSKDSVITDHGTHGGFAGFFVYREEERLDSSLLYSLPEKENPGTSINQMSLGPNSIMASPDKSSNRPPLSPRRPVGGDLT
jgi:hypothetical protein